MLRIIIAVFIAFILWVVIRNLFYLYRWMQTENKLVENLEKWDKEEKENLQK